MAGKFVSLFTVTCLLSLGASDLICPSTAFLEKRNATFEDVKDSIKKVVMPGDDGSKTDRELYEDIATNLERPVTESDYLQYTKAVGEIAIASFQYCKMFDISTIIVDDITILINTFESNLDDKKLREARKVYGILLCINSKQSSKRSADTELHTFFDSLDSVVLEVLIFSYSEEEEEDTNYSLAFVVDDSGSMSEEIAAVKALINGFIRTENDEPITYILSTFNDPITDNKGPFIYNARNTDDLNRLKNDVNALYAHGGDDCPEYGMQAIVETLTVVYPYSNIIVLTDAPAKDDSLKSVIIGIAEKKENSIHFFISSSSCDTAETSLQHYRDIADSTDGIVVESITDLSLLARFSKLLRSKLSDDSDKRKRSSAKSVTFYVSVFTESIDILFTKFSTGIAVIIPEGSTVPVSMSDSLASYNHNKPSPGQYIISSNGEFEYNMVLKSTLDVLVEHYGNKSTRQVSGEYIRVIVSSTQIHKINTTSPVILQLISTNGTLLNETTLTVCIGVFAGYVTVPEVPYQYRIKGYDDKGYPFSSRKSLLNNPAPTPIVPTSVPEINTCPCENGGTCVNVGGNVTSCSCPSSYSGQLCQEALVCSNLVPPLHGTNRCYLGNDGIPNPGDTCDIGCKYDYDQIGSLTRMCTKDGIWDGRETTCVKRTICPLIYAPAHGLVNCALGGGGEANPGEYCSFQCYVGYELLGSATRTCGDDGNWSGNVNVCVKEGTIRKYYNVTIVTDPIFDGNNNIFVLPVGSDLRVTCMVTPTPPSDSEFSWSCSTGCFVDMETEQSINITELEVTDSGELNCSVIIDDVEYTSESVELQVTGPDNSCMDGTCEHTCIPGDNSYTCQCEDGYFLAANNYSCVKCAEFNGDEMNSTWQVALCNNSTNEFICAGTAINDQWILTSAACVCNGVDKTNISIRYGKQKTCFYSEHQEVQLAALEVFCYPGFEPDQLSADFALVKLQSPIPLETVKQFPPLCLAKNRHKKEVVEAGQQAIIFGWGKIGERVPDDAIIHSTGNVTIADKTKCTLEGSNVNGKRMMCTAAYTSVACNGNYGSAVIVINDNKLLLAAVVSKRTKSCGSDHSYIFHSKTRNIEFIKWSNNILRN